MNAIGRGFNISKDLLLKASLVLCERSDIRFKADNFDKNNMLVIEKRWDEITVSMRLAVELISSFGFSRDNLTSNNPLIPIAYYINKIGNPEYFSESAKYKNDRKRIKKWFVSSILQRLLSYSSSDSILKMVCDVIKANHDEFPISEIYEKLRKNNKDMSYTEESIEQLLYTKYGSGEALMVMSIIYPWANLKNNYHIDHIHPKTLFTEKRLRKNGIPEESHDFYLENYNYLGNLQLLEAIPNEEKNSSFFEDWMDENYSNPEQRKDYMKKHYIPDVDFAFTNFEEFFTEREKLLTDALKKYLM